MSCDLEYFVVHSYFDGELSAIRAAEFKHHLADCSEIRRLPQRRATVEGGGDRRIPVEVAVFLR